MRGIICVQYVYLLTCLCMVFLQGARESSISEMNMLRSATSRDPGKSPVASGMPFKEQQLKQLRAQCLVFLAFR